MTFEEYVSLNKQLLKANDFYYSKGYALMSDYDFDIKLKKIEKYEEENKDKVLKNSISKKPDIKNKKNKIMLEVPMLSLRNTYDLKDLNKWFTNITKKHAIKNFNITYKYDGTAVCLVFYKGILIKATTKGDGTYGLDILEQVKNMKIPKNLYLPEYTFIMGDLILTKKNFNYINKILNSKYKNSKNAISDILNTTNVDKKICSRISFLPYDMYNEKVRLGKSDKLKYLSTLGFDKPLLNLKITKVEDLKHPYGLVKRNRDSLDIPIDGLVIEVDNKHLMSINEVEVKYKALAITLKLPPETYETKLIDISWSKSKVGKWIPVGLLEPIVTEEFTISKVNLFNIDFIKNIDLKIFDKVTIIRSDVNSKLIKNKHTRDSKEIIIPK